MKRTTILTCRWTLQRRPMHTRGGLIGVALAAAVGLAACGVPPDDAATGRRAMASTVLPGAALPAGYDADLFGTAAPGVGFNDIAVDPEGGVVGAYASRTRVPCNSYLAYFSGGNAPQQIYARPCVDLPYSVAFDRSGRLYFAEGAGYYDDVYTIPRGGSAPDRRLFLRGAVVVVRDMAFGPDGALYIADVYRRHILRVSPTGQRSVFVRGLGTRWTSPGAWMRMAWDSSGMMFVADAGRMTLWTITPSGQIVAQVRLPAYPTGIAVLAGDQVLVSNNDKRILHLVADGTLKTWASGFSASRLATDRRGKALYLSMEEEIKM